MANWAIVIGINQYWKPEACLKGAINDARKMCEWLLRVDGGAVPPRNLYLLLSPKPDDSDEIAGIRLRNVQLGEATHTSVIKSIETLLQRSGGQGERLFFYFSGHGIASRISFSNENAITFSDFTNQLTTNSLTLRSLFELFQGTQFREQFFFIDGCRNIPWKKEYRLGEYPNPRPQTSTVPPQFIMYATSPGVKAREIGKVGNEQGAFTSALLEGLAGNRIAKVWDDNAQEYFIRWYSLFKYVEDQVGKMKLRVGDELIQIPRQDGEHGSENPELGRFSADAFPPERLDVNLNPPIILPQSKIIVGDYGGEVDTEPKPGFSISELPVLFQQLPPRTYSVRAAIAGYIPERRYYPVDLYEPKTVEVKLLPGQVVPGKGKELDTTGLTKGFGDEPTPGTIEIISEDRLAKLELADNTGKVIAKGNGTLWVTERHPGFYRARIISPEGNPVEKLIELLPGETEKIELPALTPPDSPLFREVINRAGISIQQDNTLYPSEAVGPIAFAQLSTILALAGGAANEETGYGIGIKLSHIGVSSFQQIIGEQASSGMQILFGIEADTPEQAREYLSGFRIRCWDQNSRSVPEESEQPQPLEQFAGLAEFAWEKEPGSYWLSLETDDQEPVAIAVTVMPRRLTLVVFDRDVTGEINIYQYMPSLDSRDPRDPRREIASFPVLQRSELIQRAYMSGRLEEPDENARLLLYAKWREPIAGCLGGYILLKVNPQDELLGEAVRNLTHYFGELSDSHVLHAEYLDSQAETQQASEAFRRALDCGIPVLVDGLIRLKYGIERHQIEHGRSHLVQQIFENRVRGLIWSAIPGSKLGLFGKKIKDKINKVESLVEFLEMFFMVGVLEGKNTNAPIQNRAKIYCKKLPDAYKNLHSLLEDIGDINKKNEVEELLRRADEILIKCANWCKSEGIYRGIIETETEVIFPNGVILHKREAARRRGSSGKT